ncbi:MAG TPA: YncE family protein [Nitrosopumilaceae archaeon]|nr:YncE family protein [Nitrosopumilaceae archaeon]
MSKFSHKMRQLLLCSGILVIFSLSLILLPSLIDVYAFTTDTIVVGHYPFGVVVNTDTNKIYVTNSGSISVSVIDGSTNGVIANIGVGAGPWGIAINTNTNKIYVTGSNGISGGNSVSVIDGHTNQITTTIPLPAAPSRLAVNQITNKIYVTGQYANSLFVIDGSNNKYLRTLSFETQPMSVTSDPVNSYVYALHWAPYGELGRIDVIDSSTDKVVDTIKVGNRPMGLAIDQNSGKMYVPDIVEDQIFVIDKTSHKIINTIKTVHAEGIDLNPKTGMVYLVDFNHSLQVIDETQEKVIDTITVGNGPWQVAVNPSTNMVYVPSSHDTISVVDGSTNKVVVSPASYASEIRMTILSVSVASGVVSVYFITKIPVRIESRQELAHAKWQRPRIFLTIVGIYLLTLAVITVSISAFLDIYALTYSGPACGAGCIPVGLFPFIITIISIPLVICSIPAGVTLLKNRKGTIPSLIALILWSIVFSILFQYLGQEQFTYPSASYLVEVLLLVLNASMYPLLLNGRKEMNKLMLKFPDTASSSI